MTYFLIAIIIFLPLQFALNVSENIDLVTTRILIPVVFLLWLARSFARKRVWVPNKAETWLIMAFLFFSSLSLVLGRDFEAGFRKILYFLTIFPIYFIAADVLQSEKWKKITIVSVVASGALAAIIGLFQFILPFFVGIGKTISIWENLAPFFLGNSFGQVVAANSSWLVNISSATWMRAFGFFPDPHNFAFFVNLCFFVSLGYFFHHRKDTPKFWTGASLVLMLGALILSFSRGVYLGLAAGIIFFVILFLKRSKISAKLILGIIFVIIPVIIFSSGVISQRLSSAFNLKEGSNTERIKNWKQAVEITAEYPLSGVGLGNYSRTVDSLAPDRSSIYAHNLYLDIAAETGIINAFIFFLLLLVVIWRNIKNKDMLSLGIAAGLVGFSVHSLFDTALYSPQVLTIFLILVALNCHCEEHSDEAISGNSGKYGIALLRSQ